LTKFAIVVGNIVDQEADAIGNAANAQLERGGGVCGAIFAAACEGLSEEIALRYPDGCPTGDAIETAGHGLRARHIIHAVAPVCNLGEIAEKELLAGAYYNAIRVAAQTGCRSVVLPSLGTGIYGWPIELATPVAHSAVLSALMDYPQVEQITFCCFREADAEVFRRVFAAELE
jgi:O-acetyl-ADP-ribose deacetylase (regulator of RNase III)